MSTYISFHKDSKDKLGNLSENYAYQQSNPNRITINMAILDKITFFIFKEDISEVVKRFSKIITELKDMEKD